MRRIEKIVIGAARSLAVAGPALLLVLATFTLFDGLLRALANYPLDFVREVASQRARANCVPRTGPPGLGVPFRAEPGFTFARRTGKHTSIRRHQALPKSDRSSMLTNRKQ